MRQFLRKVRARDPLPITMSGVRMGERILQVGLADARLAGLLAAKVGLSGHAAIAVTTEEAAARARHGTAEAGSLADVHVATFDALPFGAQDFDVVVVHGTDGLLASAGTAGRLTLLRECYRVLRPGGRLVTIEAGVRTGLSRLFRAEPASDPAYAQSGGALGALESAGFRPARRLGEGDGMVFTEGFRRRDGGT